MGYACPVCGDPQADAEHLANHLAFTALARGGDHEAWLDERVPDWGEMDEASLGERVTEHAEETEFPQVFDDTTDHDHSHGRAHRRPGDERGHSHGQDPTAGDGHPLLDAARSRAGAPVADDASDVLEEARELTRRRRENALQSDGDDSTGGAESADGSDIEASDDSETE